MSTGYCDRTAANNLRSTFADMFRWENYMPLDDFIQKRDDIYASLRLPENEANIKETLACDCSRCNRYLLSDTPTDPRHVTNLINKIRTSAIGVYALCVFIRYSRLIVPLLENGITDGNLSTIVRPGTDLADFAEFQQDEAGIASSFVELSSKFVSPIIRRGDPHVEVSNIRSLPFSLPQGGRSGEIALLNRYNGIGNTNSRSATTKLYVTRSRTNDEDFNSEKVRYEWLRKRLGGPNMMEMLYSFRLQDSIYVVYEKAETNLKAYLDEPPAGDHQWLLKQFSCVIDAIETLQRIARYHTESAVPSTEFYGVHFNLEPSKLLIRRHKGKPLLLVTGFGRQAPGSISEYTPPEAFDRSQARYAKNHTYHVWSLGYILLDIIKCVKPLANGIGGLGRRSLNGNGIRPLQAHLESVNGSIRSVRSCDTHKELAPLREKWRTDTLMCGRLDLIRDMVEKNFRYRPSLRTVKRVYENLFNDRKTDMDAFILPGDSEREIGVQDVHWLRLFEGPRVSDFRSGTPMNGAEISALFARYSKRCRVQLFGGYRDDRPTPDLRITSIAHREEADLVSQINVYTGPGSRLNEHLYLWFVHFATRSIGSPGGDKNSNEVQNTISEERCALSICNNVYIFDRMKVDLGSFQSCLVGYDVRLTIPIVSCKFRRKSTFGKSNQITDARYIQIWRFPDTETRVPPIPGRVPVHQPRPKLSRLVILGMNHWAIVQVDSVQLQLNHIPGTQSATIELSASKDSLLSAAFIACDREMPPGVPLNRSDLDLISQTQQSLSMLEICLASQDSASKLGDYLARSNEAHTI
ncbi:hypothetical protein TWF730_006178 [Orbilia blumenaviensis]|uniref:Protein kinase domain-containing protein n=1 Tax=Orbilia blumenaviensis TaxID=1796055 RepID=A0AAV9TYC8_9PEZI